LHAKREDYAWHGVQEYLVLSLAENRLRWFDLWSDFELSREPDGVVRVKCFPEPWIQVDGLLVKGHPRLIDTLGLGLASPKRAAFGQTLQAAKGKGARCRLSA
jgi:hypothetical protein